MNMSSVSCLVFSLATLVCLCSASDVTISYCENGKQGEWQQRLSGMLIGVPFTVQDVTCDNVNSSQFAISIRYPLQPSEVISESTQETFFDTVIRKLASKFITTVSGDVDILLNGVDDAVVAYVTINSNTHTKFQQAVISPSLPKNFQVFELANKNQLPQAVRSQVKDKLHVWIVTSGQWSHIGLPQRGMHADGLFHNLISIFSKLQHLLKVTYDSPETYYVYKREGFHLFTVYHHTNQLDQVYNTIIDPLVNIFRPYFVFVTFDIDKHNIPSGINKNSPFPYIVTLRDGQKSGVHFDSDHTSFSFVNLKNILDSIADPSVNNVEPMHQIDPIGISVSHIDIKTFQSNNNRDQTLGVAGLCEIGSQDCGIIEEIMKEAITSVSKLGRNYEMTFYIVECPSIKDVSLVEVPILPYILKKDYDRKWELYSRTITEITFIRAVEELGSNSRSREDNVHYTSNEREDAYNFLDDIEELNEDDSFALHFSENLIIPDSLPKLTTDNYNDFINEHSGCLLAFYLPYTFKYKPMVYHILNSTEQLLQGGITPAIVNCFKYPDVCEVFNIIQYPTIKYRRESTDKWVTYKGILSDTELVKLANNIQSNEKFEESQGIVELTPLQLMKILKSNGLTTLLLLSSSEVTKEMKDVLSGVNEYTIYWINSMQHSTLSEFLIGAYHVEAAVLVWADYVTRAIYRLDVKSPTTKQQVQTFIRDVTTGNRKPDSEISQNDWKPQSPPIKFPSAHFIYQQEEHDRYNNRHDDSYHSRAPVEEGALPYNDESVDYNNQHDDSYHSYHQDAPVEEGALPYGEYEESVDYNSRHEHEEL